MNLTDGAKALLMFDVMKGQATNAVIWLLKKQLYCYTYRLQAHSCCFNRWLFLVVRVSSVILREDTKIGLKRRYQNS